MFVYDKVLAQAIMEAEKSHDLHLQVGDPEKPMVSFEILTASESMV